MLVSSPRASGFAGFCFGSLVLADFLHRVVDEGLQFIRVGSGVVRFDALDGLTKHAPADGLFPMTPIHASGYTLYPRGVPGPLGSASQRQCGLRRVSVGRVLRFGWDAEADCEMK